MIEQDVVALHEVDETNLADVGGKGAQLGTLSRIAGIEVPPGFCVTTHAFRRFLAQVPAIDDRLDQVSRVEPDDAALLGRLSAQLRRAIEDTAIPDELATAITHALTALGETAAYAVRSSATAEDLPTASFAGQQDTYLNVVGPSAVLDHVRRCWASLFTERAVAYRRRHGIDDRGVSMAVVVQELVSAHASGVLFTADPVTGHRRTAAIEATVGLGGALVSGLVDPDTWTVRDGQVISKALGRKQFATESDPSGGTRQVAVDPQSRHQPALTDAQAAQLVDLGRRIEAHFGRPQDIEWCLADNGFRIVQSRPITTLFPIPEAGDEAFHVYLSVGHQQMMTDAMRPLGLSFWQLTTPRPMAEAGGRLFVDVTQILASPPGRAGLLALVDRSDPLIGDAFRTVLARDELAEPHQDDSPAWTPPSSDVSKPIETDPAIVSELIARSEASIAAARRDIAGLSGRALIDFIEADLQELRRLLFDPTSHQVFLSAMEAAWWLDEHLESWLGEQHTSDVLTRSVPHNVTSEMGLALLDVADVIRPHPEVIAFLEQVEDDGFLDRLPQVPGGRDARAAIERWLERYGMRCVGEIDITRPRWREQPSMLVPLILGHVEHFEPGEAERRFEQGRQEAVAEEQDVLERLRALPDGEEKAVQTKQMIDRVRTFIGYREYPKYAMVSRYFVHKLALLREADRLVRAQVMRAPDDIFFLTFAELADVVRTNHADDELIERIDRRRDAFETYRTLTPPRVLTSDGEAVTGAYRRDDVPAGALLGLPVSAGTVEGRARVVLDLAQADLRPGDILVTTHTDPSWTPLFVTVAGLVTEVGGTMTHGAVIAREYGLPAVVGVVDATRRIRDGQRIRVHGAAGYVELLDVRAAESSP